MFTVRRSVPDLLPQLRPLLTGSTNRQRPIDVGFLRDTERPPAGKPGAGSVGTFG